MPKVITSIDLGLKKIVEIQKCNLNIAEENKRLVSVLYQNEKLRSKAVLLILFLNFCVSVSAIFL